MSVAGCSEALPDDRSNVVNSSRATVSEKVIATLSCRVNGQPMEVALCFAADSDQQGGSLKIASAGEVKQYAPAELLQPTDNPDDFLTKVRIQQSIDVNGPVWQMPLVNPFLIEAQTRGDPDYVLRMTIKIGSKIVLQDEASDYGVIRVDSDVLNG